MNSRQKGKRIEREAAQLLRDCGFASACRGAQHSGSPDSPDVKGVPGWHIEVKGCERLNLGAACQQAIGDSGGQDWMILHKKNRGDWKVTLDAKKFLDVLAAIRGNTPVETGKPDDPITVILALVEASTGVTHDRIVGKDQTVEARHARKLAHWLAYTATDTPVNQLEAAFGVSDNAIAESVKIINTDARISPLVRRQQDELYNQFERWKQSRPASQPLRPA